MKKMFSYRIQNDNVKAFEMAMRKITNKKKKNYFACENVDWFFHYRAKELYNKLKDANADILLCYKIVMANRIANIAYLNIQRTY